MTLSEISVRRPVFATVMSMMLVLLGVVSFSKLSVREYPRIDEPVVTVNTRLLGASSEVIESQVTKPLEDSIAGIDGVECMYVQDDGSDGEAVTLSEEFLSNWWWRAFDGNTDGACA